MPAELAGQKGEIGPMAYKSLREFMDRLEREGRLVRVTEPVSPVLEMTEIQTRLLAEQGPAADDDGRPGSDAIHESPEIPREVARIIACRGAA